jgi:hypothetical protein
MLSLAVSVLSLVVSVISGVVAVLAVQTTKRIALQTSTLQLHNFADQICTANPSLYELHGITEDDLKREGISFQELSYVVHSFDAGEAYYLIQNPSQVELTEYRRQMLRHPKVRRIWKQFVVGKTLSPSRFSAAVDLAITEIEELEAKRSASTGAAGQIVENSGPAGPTGPRSP